MATSTADDRQLEIEEDACLALTGAAEQCGNGTDTDASDPEAGFCGVHADTDAVAVTDFGEPAWVGLRDDLVDLLRSEKNAYALATISADIEDVWAEITSLEDTEIGAFEFDARKLCYLAREVSEHPDLDVGDHPLGYPNCIALQGKSAKNHSCPNSAYGTSLLCGMHQDSEIRGTILDEGEPGPDLETIIVDGVEYQLVEERGDDLIVVDPDEWELHRLEGQPGEELLWNDPETTPDLSDDAETLVLVGCGDAKADEPRKAKNLYTSNYAGLKRDYAEEYADEWAILSAKYGLLDPEAEIEPYDVSDDDVDVGDWGVAVAGDLPDVQDTEVVVLAGPDYAEEVEGTLFMYGAEVDVPGEGKKIGERMSWLSEQLEDSARDGRDDGDSEEEQRGYTSETPDGPAWAWSYDGPVRLATYLRENYATTDRAKELAKHFETIEQFEDAAFDEKLTAAGVNGRAKSAILEEYESAADLQYRARSSSAVEELDGVGRQSGHVVGQSFLSWSSMSGAPSRGWNAIVEGDPEFAPDGGRDDDSSEAAGAIEEPTRPEAVATYVLDGVDRQDPEALRELAEYADQLAGYKEAEAERELQEDAVDEEPPEEWDDDEWEDALEDARDDGDVPAGKGTLTTKTVDGREYYYLQWREGDTVASKYVAPVTPKN